MWRDGLNTGLKVWLVFLVTFVLVGFPAELCIGLGAIAGIAGGVIAGRWNAKDVPAQPVEEMPGVALSPVRLARKQLTELREKLKERTRQRRSPRLRRRR